MNYTTHIERGTFEPQEAPREDNADSWRELLQESPLSEHDVYEMVIDELDSGHLSLEQASSIILKLGL